MKSLTIAAFVLIASVAMTTSGQVKSVAAANNHSSAKSSAPSQKPANGTRARMVGQEPNADGNVGSATVQKQTAPDFNNLLESALLRATGTAPEKAAPIVSSDRLRIGHTVLEPAASNNATPAASKNLTPALSKNLTPTPSNNSTPAASKNSTPAASKNSAPTPSNKPTPAASKNLTLAASKNSTPVLSNNSTPAASKNSTPEASKNLTPEASKNSTPTPSKNSTPPSNATSSSPAAPLSAASHQIYRVGVRDVLDIQLQENPSKESTLFTVLDDGTLEYPLAGDPIVVDGLTTPEIATLLRTRLKIFDNPTVAVKVRDYASHSVTVTGFVGAPGTKALRREATPLYAILTECQVLPDAASATITRQGRTPLVVDLKDVDQSSTMVVSGDAIKVSGETGGPTEFFFIGGEISSPGQKAYHEGLTLTQAILASGGTKTNAGSKIRVSRQGANGLLTTEEYNLRKIQSGKVADPVLQKGDRIEITNMK